MSYRSIKELVEQQLSGFSDINDKRLMGYHLLRFQGFVHWEDSSKPFTKEDYMTLCDEMEEGETTTLIDTDSLDRGETNLCLVTVKKEDGLLLPIFYMPKN